MKKQLTEAEKALFREQAKTRHIEDEHILNQAFTLSSKLINPTFSLSSIPQINDSSNKRMILDVQLKMLPPGSSASPDSDGQAERFHEICTFLSQLSYSRVSIMTLI
jgi:hypothetical protein